MADHSHDNFIEMENPGELTGTIMMDDVPYLLAGDVGYDVTLTKDVPLKDLMDAVGKDVTVTIDRIYRAGIIAPQLGHIIVSKLTVHEPKTTTQQ
jgi:hypothetical protein